MAQCMVDASNLKLSPENLIDQLCPHDSEGKPSSSLILFLLFSFISVVGMNLMFSTPSSG